MKTLERILILISIYSIAIGANSLTPYGPVDDVIRNLLESLRPRVANLSIAELPINVSQGGVTVLLNISDVFIENLDTFVIEALESSLVPIELKNITLSVPNVILAGYYDVSGVVNVTSLQGPIELFGNGDISMYLEDIFFTSDILFQGVGGKLQIRPKGITKFDVSLNKANITIENLLGSPEFSEVAGLFLSFFLPDFVEDFKCQLFEQYEDAIIDALNKVLENVDFP